MKSTVSFSAHVAESFQSIINWNAVKNNASIFARKSLSFLASDMFAIAILSLSSIASFVAAVIESNALPWLAAIASVALLRVLLHSNSADK